MNGAQSCPPPPLIPNPQRDEYKTGATHENASSVCILSIKRKKSELFRASVDTLRKKNEWGYKSIFWKKEEKKDGSVADQ